MFILYLAVLGTLGAAAMSQTFTNSGEINITTCPITYYGHKYEKVHVAFNNSKFALCFTGTYEAANQNDCILVSGGTADNGNWSVLTQEIPTGSGIHQMLPSLKHRGQCVNVIPLKDNDNSEIQQVELGNFGKQAILAIKTYSGYTNVDLVADVQVNGHTVSKYVFPTNETSMGVIRDMSGCRMRGFVYMTNTTVSDPYICSRVTCDVNGVATAVSECPPMYHCQGNGSCAFNTMCTLTGSTVIDFVGRVHAVPDRCGYNLMTSDAIQDVRIHGVYRERRLKDVSFLDHVILHLSSQDVNIILLQGSRVKINGELSEVSTTAKVVHGVELSKGQSGVTAKILGSNYTLSVFFDGTTAQIHLMGVNGGVVHGLCGNSSLDFNQQRVAEHSITECEMQHEETDMINSTATTEWCHILWQDPFTQCHMHINPEPFVSACVDNLSKYPAVDGLKCHLVEAYVRACHTQGNVSIDGWRSIAQCDASPQALCQDMYCSDHEFCGQGYDGEAHCQCRAIFASKYKSMDEFGEPMVCSHSSASINMFCCLLAEKGIDYTTLHLHDEQCKGDIDNETHVVKFSFTRDSTCGAIITANTTKISYQNIIATPNISTVVTRSNKMLMDFSCHFDQPNLEGMAIKMIDSPVIKEFTSGEWNYTLTMAAYTDPDRTQLIELRTSVQLNQKIWVEIKAYGLDGSSILLVTESCWATNQSASNGSLRYDLISAGCPNPADGTIKIEGNGEGTSNYFSFNTFKFSDNNNEMFLHCKVELCVQQGDSCSPNCNNAGRRRRSVPTTVDDGGPSIITMAWT
ncbi:alpha-tectorin-like [Syngnathus typhle]|uniref:alpha-tectorin-like n=1 Tax=Syngnathus typhle TaxID=161592 RepID=UPI002A6A3312|nr:alpha-tectorin-like [Syngnathus typhle]